MGSKTASLGSQADARTVCGAAALKKIGVVRYLQLKKDLLGGIKAVMRSKYPAEAHTYMEWEGLLERTLNRKVK